MKHRGTIHFQGLGEQYDKPYMTVNIEGKDITYNMFVKHEVAIEDLYGELLEFDQLFFAYFQSLLEEIVPSKYFLISDNLLDVLNVSTKIANFKENELAKYENLFQEFYLNNEF